MALRTVSAAALDDALGAALDARYVATVAIRRLGERTFLRDEQGAYLARVADQCETAWRGLLRSGGDTHVDPDDLHAAMCALSGAADLARGATPTLVPSASERMWHTVRALAAGVERDFEPLCEEARRQAWARTRAGEGASGRG